MRKSTPALASEHIFARDGELIRSARGKARLQARPAIVASQKLYSELIDPTK
jgi:hypothetical protein